ncbi:STAS domain-containing protein [Limnobacter humi]|uniref:STAS domain-containing protein n=1 Tax=Limnobacter humi TaxID=1778671 RepID=A0ABT1WKD1_9BURK|nr:STAS domain-containing protein [Limnobacter humi]MCQ8897458.1 STAS domain-containing protein [Limnobacter humi]
MKISAEAITVRNGEQVIAEVTKAVAGGDRVLDFSNVQHIDSTALAVVLAAQRVAARHASQTDKTLQLQHTPTQLQSLVAAYGVQSLFL